MVSSGTVHPSHRLSFGLGAPMIGTDMLDDRLLPQEIKACCAIEAFQIAVLVEMLHSASDIINFAHHGVMTRANEKLGSAPELLPGLPGIG